MLYKLNFNLPFSVQDFCPSDIACGAKEVMIGGACLLGLGVVSKFAHGVYLHEKAQRAILRGDLEATRRLLDSGVDVNMLSMNGISLLTRSLDYPEITHLLLDRGAGINTRDTSGFTALTYSIVGNLIPAQALLLEQGSPIGRPRSRTSL